LAPLVAGAALVETESLASSLDSGFTLAVDSDLVWIGVAVTVVELLDALGVWLVEEVDLRGRG